ncbi:MAG TPA: peptidylprolyl isomerase, partial [Gemmatimonadaceae bacterium]
ARAGTQELSVDRLSTLLSQLPVPPNADIARTVANAWVDYELMGQAAAHNDSLNNHEMVHAALWPVITRERMNLWHDTLMQHTPLDTANAEAKYNAGDVLAASHILFTVPRNATPAVKDSIRRQAESVRRQVTPANFAALARKYSKDPGSAARGGSLGVFKHGYMVKEFEDGVLALKPGQISPLVETQFGYHIIERTPYSAVKAEVQRAVQQDAMAAADSAYLEKVDAAGDIKFKDDAAAIIKKDSPTLDEHRDDKTVIATSTAGDFTVGRLAQWLDLYQQKPQILQSLPEAPDTVVLNFVHNVVRNEVVLHQADSAKIAIDSADMAQLHQNFGRLVEATWEGLGVSPDSLADSAKTPSERERVAASRVDQYLDKLVANQARFVQIPGPLETVLHEKYEWKLNQTGIDHAVEQAKKQRAAADSARDAKRPPTAVPLGPGASAKPAAPGTKPDSGKR